MREYLKGLQIGMFKQLENTKGVIRVNEKVRINFYNGFAILLRMLRESDHDDTNRAEDLQEVLLSKISQEYKKNHSVHADQPPKEKEISEMLLMERRDKTEGMFDHCFLEIKNKFPKKMNVNLNKTRITRCCAKLPPTISTIGWEKLLFYTQIAILETFKASALGSLLSLK